MFLFSRSGFHRLICVSELKTPPQHHNHPDFCPSRPVMLIPRPFFVPLILLFLLPPSLASSGDRNPNFQHCLRGCSLTRCDPSQPPPPLYLRAFGWRCDDECKYDCTHRFTDNIRVGGTWHQCECKSRRAWPKAGRSGGWRGRMRARERGETMGCADVSPSTLVSSPDAIAPCSPTRPTATPYIAALASVFHHSPITRFLPRP